MRGARQPDAPKKGKVFVVNAPTPPVLHPDLDADDHGSLPERGRACRVCREARGMSQSRLGEVTGLGQAQISNYEAGRRGMSVTTAIVIARALAVTTDQLFGLEPPPSSESDDMLASDPYPNRRRLRKLPEFEQAPDQVRDIIVRMRRPEGDQPYVDWLVELTALVKFHADGHLGAAFEGKEIAPAPGRQIRPGRGRRL
jgi:transcriptional regulator with XRE-family HTH domain